MPTALHAEQAGASEADVGTVYCDLGLSGLQHDLLAGEDVDAVVDADHGDVFVSEDFQLVGVGLQ